MKISSGSVRGGQVHVRMCDEVDIPCFIAWYRQGNIHPDIFVNAMHPLIPAETKKEIIDRAVAKNWKYCAASIEQVLKTVDDTKALADLIIKEFEHANNKTNG